MANDSAPTITLNNGVDIPQIGYGVFLTPPEETERAVLEAFEVGYRHVDTAQAYRNEEGVGAAVAACGLPREDVFLTTKVWLTNAGDERAARSIDGSLRRLGTDYIDLLLVHQPFGDYYGTYRAMEKALAAGKVRAIGVSNFFPDRFVDLAQHVEVPPAVNQMETHVFNQQTDTRTWYTKYGTALESWGPLAQGRNNIFTHPVLTEVGEKYGKTAAQVALRYLIQLDIIVIPKTVHRERMVTNLDVTDFQLDDADMRDIAALDEGQGVVNHYDPAFQERLASYTVEADGPPAACGRCRLPAGTFDAAGCGPLRAGTFDAVGDRNPAPVRAGCPRPEEEVPGWKEESPAARNVPVSVGGGSGDGGGGGPERARERGRQSRRENRDSLFSEVPTYSSQRS